MSELVVYDDSGARLGLVENATSVQWMAAYQAPGEVKLVARATPANLALLREGRRLHLAGEDEAALVESVETDADSAGATLTARGRTTAARLDARVAMGALWADGAEAAMRALVENNLRGLPLSLGPAGGFAEAAGMEIAWGTVLQGVEKLAKVAGLGFRVVFEPAGGGEQFVVYKGVDRRAGAAYNGWLGDDVGSLSGLRLEVAADSFKNVAVVAGEGTGTARTVVFASRAEGLPDSARRELFVDARDLTRLWQKATDTGQKDGAGNPVFSYSQATYTEAEYQAALRGRGLQALAAHTRILKASAEATGGVLAWRRDFFLGDRLPVKLTGLGLNLSARVASVKRVLEAGGERTVLGLDEFEMEDV